MPSFLFHGADDETRRKKFGVKSFGEFDALSVFSGHGETKDVDAAGAKPLLDCRKFVVHKLIITDFIMVISRISVDHFGTISLGERP